MGEKTFQFKIKAVYEDLGIVTANNEEEAKQLILDGEWDDIIDSSWLENGDIIEIEEG